MKFPWRVFILFLLVYLITMGGHLYSPDEEIIFRTTQSMVERQSLAIEPLAGFATKKGPGGEEYAQYGIGQPVLTIPFYLLGKLMVHILPGENAPTLVQDNIQYYQITGDDVILRLGVSFYNQVITALLCSFLFMFCIYLTGDKTASWLTTLLFGLGTYAMVHARTYFTEPTAALFAFTAFFLLFIGLDKKSPARIMIAGFLYAFSILVRMDSLFMLPGYLALIFFHNAGKPDKNVKAALKAQFKIRREDETTYSNSIIPWKKYYFFAPLILSVTVILILNKVRFGSFTTTGYEDQQEGFKFSTPLLVGIHGFLCSPGRGLFFFSPPLLLALFGIRRFFNRRIILATGWGVLILSFFLVQSKWQNWPGGWCWGPRHIYQVHVFLALPLCFIFLKPFDFGKRVLFYVFLIPGLMIQIYGCSQNFIDYNAEFFITPRTQPNNYMIWYMETEQHLNRAYALYRLDMAGNPDGRIPLHTLVAPVHNDVYIPQHTVWANYLKLLKMGRHDFFWIKLIAGNEGTPPGALIQQP